MTLGDTVSETHLWEVDHPYYCSQGNFHRNGQHVVFESWEDFVEDGWANSDHDLNLLFRWDWEIPEDEAVEEGDPPARAQLLLFFMLQRKGDFWSVGVTVTQSDEPAVREWLAERAKTIAAIWAPITLGGAS